MHHRGVRPVRVCAVGEGRVMRRLLSSLASLARRLADRIEVKRPVEHDARCLTCRIRDVIAEHAIETAGPLGPVIDTFDVINAFATLVSEISLRAGNDVVADMIVASAHRALDDAMATHRARIAQLIASNAQPQAVH